METTVSQLPLPVMSEIAAPAAAMLQHTPSRTNVELHPPVDEGNNESLAAANQVCATACVSIPSSSQIVYQ